VGIRCGVLHRRLLVGRERIDSAIGAADIQHPVHDDRSLYPSLPVATAASYWPVLASTALGPPPMGAVRRGVPFAEVKAWRLPSKEAIQAMPPATAGDDSTIPPVV